MANAIVTTDRADLWKHVANLACSTQWSPDLATADCGPRDLAEIERILRSEPRPLAETEPNGMSLNQAGCAGAFTTVLGDTLAGIYLKLSPNGGTEQSAAWVKVMQRCLDDLAGEVAVRAAKAALRRPLRFHNEVDGAIREEAAKIMAARVMAATRIAALRDSLAAQPDSDDNADQSGPVDLSLRTIAAMPDALCRIGIARGWLTQDMVNEAQVADQTGRAAYVPDERAA